MYVGRIGIFKKAFLKLWLLTMFLFAMYIHMYICTVWCFRNRNVSPVDVVNMLQVQKVHPTVCRSYQRRGSRFYKIRKSFFRTRNFFSAREKKTATTRFLHPTIRVARLFLGLNIHTKLWMTYQMTASYTKRP
jgi:hypothetical protein